MLKRSTSLFLVTQKKKKKPQKNKKINRKPEKEKQGKEVSYKLSNKGRRTICSEPIYVVCVCA